MAELEVEVEGDDFQESRPTEVHHVCRLCKEKSRTKILFERERPTDLVHRLAKLGVTVLLQADKSSRICMKCVRYILRIEDSLATLQKWKRAESQETNEETGSEQVAGEKRKESPSETPELKKKKYHHPTPNLPQSTTETPKPSTMPPRLSLTEVIIQYPSARVRVQCPKSAEGIVQNICKGKWSTAANHIMKHDVLLDIIKKSVCTLIDNECKRLCHSHQEFVLWNSSPDDLKAFSFAKMESDLQHLAPFLFSVLSTVTNQSTLQTCAAASIALRGRNPRVSAFAYYINMILQYNNAKKDVFQKLSKFGISTTYSNAVKKKHLLVATCGEALQALEVENESLLNPKQMRTEQQQDSEDSLNSQQDLEDGLNTDSEDGLNTQQDSEDTLNSQQDSEDGLNSQQDFEDTLNTDSEYALNSQQDFEDTLNRDSEYALNSQQDFEDTLNTQQDSEDTLNSQQDFEDGLNTDSEDALNTLQDYYPRCPSV